MKLKISNFYKFLPIIGFIFFCLSVGYGIRSCTKPVINKVYRIARDIDFHSYQLQDKEKNFLGFSDDIILWIANNQGLNVSFIKDTTPNFFNGLDQNYYDVIASPLRPTSYLQQKYLFSDSYFLLGPVLIMPKNSTVTSLEEMENKVIGIEVGASVVFEIEKYPSILIVPYENIFTALDTLVNGRIDGVIMAALSAHIYIPRLYPGELKIATQPLTKEGYRLVTKVGEEGEYFISAFNKGLEEAHKEGVYESFVTRWGLYNATQQLEGKREE